MRLQLLLAVVASLLFFTSPVLAESLEPILLDPVAHNEASLTIVGADGAITMTPAELEALGTYRLVTRTPWRPDEAAFDGVLLRDVLAMAGLEDIDGLTVTAENDYAIRMPRSVWETVPILVATRVDGLPHTRRARGPIQFVMPMNLYETSEGMQEGYWVWMASRIELAR